ncbi:MAG: formylglycine-generating enzyme family protein [Candidatus Magasanikbacteria bacterium]
MKKLTKILIPALFLFGVSCNLFRDTDSIKWSAPPTINKDTADSEDTYSDDTKNKQDTKTQKNCVELSGEPCRKIDGKYYGKYECTKTGKTWCNPTANCDINLDFTKVSTTDEFSMGPREHNNWNDTKKVTTKINNSFKIQKTEITQCQWIAVMKKNNSFNSNCSSCPVDRVNLIDAISFTNKLSRLHNLDSCYKFLETKPQPHNCKSEKYCEVPGVVPKIEFKGVNCEGFRLPLEREWAWTHRSDTTEKWGGYHSPKTVAWYKEISKGETHRVREKTPIGNIYDGLGNVWEWTWDKSSPLRSFGKTKRYPPLCESGKGVTIRGGGYSNKKEFVKVGTSFPLCPMKRRHNTGFRITQSVP